MTATARQIVTAALTAAVAVDPTIAGNVESALAALDGKTADPLVNHAPFPRVLSPGQTAELMHVSPRSLRTYARKNLIRRVFTGNGSGKKSIGYSEQSVRDYLQRITGESATPAPATAERLEL